MRRTFLKLTVVALASFMNACTDSQAQGTFHVDFAEYQPGYSLYGGFGSFTIGANVGQFELNIVLYAGDSFSPVIATPSGNWSFALGTGVPAEYRWGTEGDLMYGTQYLGSFQSSSVLLSDLLAGLGQLRMVSASGVELSGAIVLIPEPSVCALFVCGLLVMVCRGIPSR